MKYAIGSVCPINYFAMIKIATSIRIASILFTTLGFWFIKFAVSSGIAKNGY